jgi:predicted kinase
MEKHPVYVFIMLGFLGSGKSFVSRWLTPKVGAVYIRPDDLRLAIFGEDRPELYLPENKAIVNDAALYMAEQVVKSGRASVVFDGNNNSVARRQEIAEATRKHGAKVVVVHVNTPLDTAEQRTVTRRQTEGHVLFEPNLVRKMAARLELPTAEEQVLTIDGLLDAEAQQKQFDEQFARLQARGLQ